MTEQQEKIKTLVENDFPLGYEILKTLTMGESMYVLENCSYSSKNAYLILWSIYDIPKRTLFSEWKSMKREVKRFRRVCHYPNRELLVEEVFYKDNKKLLDSLGVKPEKPRETFFQSINRNRWTKTK